MDELDFLRFVRKQVIVALFSDDELLEHLVIKGGNLLDIVYGISSRASIDVDLSMDGEYSNVQELASKISDALTKTFAEHGLVVFDTKFSEEPAPRANDPMKDFWGGYRITFKLADEETHGKFKNDLQKLRQRAKSLGSGDSKPFKIDISKFEYCDGKQTFVVDDVSVYGYSPAMTVAEKLRALCQQMPEYSRIIQRGDDRGAPRARDFLDIYTVVTKEQLEFDCDEFREIVRRVFAAKKVPLKLLGKIADMKDFHEHDFESVKATVFASAAIKSFDFYFDFVLAIIDSLKPLWDE